MRKGRLTAESIIRSLIREIDEPAPITRWSQLIPFIMGPSLSSSSEAPYEEDIITPASRPADGALDAVIIGDSQAGGALGSTFKRRLEELGYAVRKTHEDGAAGEEVFRDQMPSPTEMPDLLVAIFGGNDFSTQGAVDAAKEMYESTSGVGTYLVIVGPPQATTITDPAAAGQSFPGTLGTNPEPNAWFTRDGGTYVERRLDISQALEDEMSGLPNVSVYGIGAHMIPIGGIGTGETYPDQPDGLHLLVGADRVVDNILRAIDIGAITRSLKPRSTSPVTQDYGPIEEFDYMRWREEIAKIEGNYNSVNKDSTALGKYQFVPSIWWDEIKAFAGSRLPNTHVVTRYTPKGKPIYSDYEAFLNDPELQEDWMRHYTINDVLPAVARLRRRNPELTARLSDGKLAGLVHFQGEQGGEDWLRKGIMRGADVNAVDPTGYMRRLT